MATARTELEIQLLTALRRIAAYDAPDRLRKNSEKGYGCGFEDAIEMSYENIQLEARRAIKGVRMAPVS